jgi:hypothetical protein
MSDEPKKWSRKWAWWALALFVLYPLSIGPAWWVCCKLESESVIQNQYSAYAPLGWASDRNWTFGLYLYSYLDWWTPHVPPR